MADEQFAPPVEHHDTARDELGHPRSLAKASCAGRPLPSKRTSNWTGLRAPLLAGSRLAHSHANSRTRLVRSLLEDAPVTLLARLVEQIHGESRAERAVVWGNLRNVARRMHVNRRIFR